MFTKDLRDNVTKLPVSRTVHTTITNKTAGGHEPRAKEFYIRDSRLTGFWIRVDPRGRKVFGCHGRLFGVDKVTRVTIGSTEIYTATQARKEAEKHLRDIRAGIDPKAVAKANAEKTPDTLESLMLLYLDTKENLRPRTKYDYQYRLKQNMAGLLHKDVKELDVADLRLWWAAKQGKNDPKGSKRICLGYLSAILNFAIALELIERNVAQAFKKIIGDKKGPRKGSPKKRHIKKNQIESWVWSFIKQAVAQPESKQDDSNEPIHTSSNPTISETQRDCILFLLLTGKRLDESRKITWNDLEWDEDAPTITLRPEITKAGRQDVIPMTEVIGLMLAYRSKRRNKHKKYVFENKYGSGHIIDMRKSLHKICHYSNDNFSIDLPETINHHDLRRTFSTMAEEIGMNTQEIATLLSHSTGNVTEGYITKSLERKRDKLQQIEKAILNSVRFWIMVNWYGADRSYADLDDLGPQDERPKLGFIEKLYKDHNEWGDHPQAPYRT